MTRIHFEIEALYDCLSQPLCENQAGRDAFNGKPVEMTTDEAQVTCRRCLKALGYELPSKVVPYSRMSIETDERGGRLAA